MSRLAATLKLDVKLQARSQLYAIGVLIAVVLGFMVRFLVPTDHVGRGLAAFYLLALGGTTFMFGASMLLLEKGERTLEALRVSMITTRDYVLSKAITLTAFALVESLIVYGISARGTPTSYGLLLLGVAVLGVFLTLVGLGLAASYDAVTRFLLPAGAAVGMVAQLPFLSLLDVGPPWIWYLIPTQAPLLLMQAAFEPIAGWQWGYALGMSAAMLAGAWLYCTARFRHHIRFQEG
jgi:fluoroquinolone transport system permease protein